MATKILTDKQRKFAKLFVKSFDIEDAAEKAGVRALEISRALQENDALIARVNTLLSYERIAGDYVDPEILRTRLYKMAIDEKETIHNRLRASALFFDTQQRAGGGGDMSAKKIEKIGAMMDGLKEAARARDLTNAKKGRIMESNNDNRTDTDQPAADSAADSGADSARADTDSAAA